MYSKAEDQLNLAHVARKNKKPSCS